MIKMREELLDLRDRFHRIILGTHFESLHLAEFTTLTSSELLHQQFSQIWLSLRNDRSWDGEIEVHHGNSIQECDECISLYGALEHGLQMTKGRILAREIWNFSAN